jgi:hypothetical protein
VGEGGSGDGVQTVYRNDVAGEGLAIAADGGGGILDLRAEGGEVAGAVGEGRDSGPDGVAGDWRVCSRVAKKWVLSSTIGPPMAPPNWLSGWAVRSGRRSCGIEDVVAEGLEEAAVESVRAGAGGHGDDPAGGMAVFGGVVLAMTRNSCMASTGRLVSYCGR